jgi:hypothetical protein
MAKFYEQRDTFMAEFWAHGEGMAKEECRKQAGELSPPHESPHAAYSYLFPFFADGTTRVEVECPYNSCTAVYWRCMAAFFMRQRNEVLKNPNGNMGVGQQISAAEFCRNEMMR